MKAYVYPAVFHPNSDGSFTILYPDLPGCISEGKSLENALYMAQDALTQWMAYSVDAGEEIPAASRLRDVSVDTKAGEFANLIRAELGSGRASKQNANVPKRRMLYA